MSKASEQASRSVPAQGRDSAEADAAHEVTVPGMWAAAVAALEAGVPA